MKNYVRILSLLLALLLSVSALASCGNGGGNEVTTSADSASYEDGETDISTETVTEAVAEAEPPRPAKNYGEDFFLWVHNDSNRIDYHWVEESSNDVLSQAIYDRQQKVYAHLGVTIYGTKTLVASQYIEPFKTAVKNKDGSVDTLITHVYSGVDGFITENYLTDLAGISEIDLDADYWNQDFMEQASYNGKHYLGKSDFNILYTYAVAFNKDMLDKYDDALNESLYDMVLNYRWTLDQMLSLAQMVYIDHTADGKTIDDTFGIVSEQDIQFVGLLSGCNVNLIEQNEKGEYVFSAYNEVNRAVTTDVIEKLRELAKADCSWFWPHGSGETIAFQNQTALMTLASTNNLPSYLNYEINCGVLPYPLYDESQKDVGYRSLQWGGYTCVPSYVRNLSMVGDTLEMLSFYSDSVNEAFYEKLLGKQVAESPIDKQMLQIIWDGICTDFAQTYYSALSNTQVLYMASTLTKTTNTQNLSSYVASVEKAVNKALKKMALAG